AAEFLVGDHLREHALRRAVENRFANSRQRTRAGPLGFHRREIAIRATVGLVAYVAFFLERISHVRHAGGAKPPEHTHDRELARRKVDLVHRVASTDLSVDYRRLR